MEMSQQQIMVHYLHVYNIYIKNSFFSFDLFVSGKQTLRPGLERRSTTCRAVVTAATTSRKTILEKLTSLGGLYLPHIFITMVL